MKNLLRRVLINIDFIRKNSNKKFVFLLSTYSVLYSIYPIQLFKQFTFIQVLAVLILLYVMILLLVCFKMIKKKKIVVKNFNNNHSLSVLYGDILNNLDCQIKLDFSSNSEKLGMVFDNSKIS